MKKILFFVFQIMIFGIYIANAQVLEWHATYQVHSIGNGAGKSPNSLLNNNGKISSVVVENDTLKLYQVNQQGELLNVYNTNKRTQDNYSQLIKVGNEHQAIVFKSPLNTNSLWFLVTDFELNTVNFNQLALPANITSPKIHNLFEFQNELYLTVSKNSIHYLLRINEDDTLEVVHQNNVSVTEKEHFIKTDSGVVFSYVSDNGHIIEKVDLANNSQVWETSISTGFGTLMAYSMAINGNVLYAIGAEKTWVNGLPVDKVTLSHLNVSTGDIVFQQELQLPENCQNCSVELNDFMFNQTNNKVYLSYESGFPQPAVLLLEIEPSIAQITNQRFFTFTPNVEFFQLTKTSNTLINSDGNLIFIYKSYQNSAEQMNLNLVSLDENLDISGSFVFHIDALESIEHLTDVIQYDASRIVLSGIVPHKNPSISLEQCNYFVAMINSQEMLSVREELASTTISLYPNPVKEMLYIELAEAKGVIKIFDALGKLLYQESIVDNQFKLDVSGYAKGLYFVCFSDFKNQKIKFIKN